MWPKLYGQMVEGKGTAPVAPPADAARVECVVVWAAYLLLFYFDRSTRKVMAGTGDYAAYKALALSKGTGQPLRGRDGVLAYGNVYRVLGRTG